MTQEISAVELDAAPYADVPLGDEAASSLRHIILAYLVHNCYGESALSFARSLAADADAAIEGRKDPLDIIAAQLSTTTTTTTTTPLTTVPITGTVIKESLESVDGVDETDAMEVEPTQKHIRTDSVLRSFVQSLPGRKRIAQLVREGNSAAAVRECSALFPGVLYDAETLHLANLPVSHAHVHLDALYPTFLLHCQCFIELVAADRQADALLYTQRILSKFGPIRPKLIDTLRDVVALLAYQQPASSPVGHFLSQEHRETVAETINSAILESLKAPPKTALERIVKQILAIQDAIPAIEQSGRSTGSGGNKKGPSSSAVSSKSVRRHWTLQELLSSD